MSFQWIQQQPYLIDHTPDGRLIVVCARCRNRMVRLEDRAAFVCAHMPCSSRHVVTDKMLYESDAVIPPQGSPARPLGVRKIRVS